MEKNAKGSVVTLSLQVEAPDDVRRRVRDVVQKRLDGRSGPPTQEWKS